MPTKKQILDEIKSDSEVIRSLEDDGDQHDHLHLIEHHFVSETPEPLNEVVRIGRLLGFDSADFGPNSETNHSTFSVNLLSKERIDLTRIARESILMLAIGEACGCDYDGWGTYVEKQR